MEFKNKNKNISQLKEFFNRIVSRRNVIKIGFFLLNSLALFFFIYFVKCEIITFRIFFFFYADSTLTRVHLVLHLTTTASFIYGIQRHKIDYRFRKTFGQLMKFLMNKILLHQQII